MNKTRKIAIIILIVLIIVVFGHFLVSALRSEADFKQSLPNPDEATPMYLYIHSDGTYLFVDDARIDVVVPSLTSTYGTFLASCGSSIDNMVLTSADDKYIQLLSSMKQYATIDRIFLPNKASGDFKDKILALYPDCTLVEASRGDKLVSGQYVLRFYSSSEEGALHLTHGYSTFLVGGDGYLGALKGDNITLALLPGEILKNASIDATYAVVEDYTSASEYGAVTVNVAKKPTSSVFCLSDGQNLIFDFSFEKTGKLAQ